MVAHSEGANAQDLASLPTKNTQHILIGRYSPEKPAEKRVIADFVRRNASFEHSSNKPQFSLFESYISPAFSKTNPEYFKRKIGSQHPGRRNRIDHASNRGCFYARGQLPSIQRPARYSRELIHQNGEPQSVIFITNCSYHIPRILGTIGQ